MFNQAVLRMQEDGTVQTLKDKWWVELNTAGNLNKKKDQQHIVPDFYKPQLFNI